MGNLIRYPSQVYNNYGLQWFIPYLMTVCLIAIPVLILEIAIGQAYRGGSVVAYNTMHHRLKGTGLNLIYVGFVVGPYFAVNLGEYFLFLLFWTNHYHDSNTNA
jgi:solute carrier family 6 GABA transporter-like protein 1